MIDIDGELQTLTPPAFAWPEPGPAGPRDPLGDLAAPLVEALAAAGWDAPGVTVRMTDDGYDGEGWRRHVSVIEVALPEGPFRARFGRNGGRTTVVEAGFAPGFLARWWDDASCDGLDALVGGGDWRVEGSAWMDAFRHDERLDGRERRTLRMRTGRRGQGAYRADDDMGRMYAARSGEPSVRSKERVADEARAACGRAIAALLAARGRPFPGREAAEAELAALRARPAMPVPADMPRLHAWVSEEAMRRMEGRELTLKPGYRLAPAGGKAGWTPYVYLSFDPAKKAGHVLHGGGDGLPAVVELRSLDGVFVVDDAAYERARDALFAAMASEDPPRDRLTDAELDAAVAAVATTLTPYADYVHGSHADPTVVVRRRLGPDEVRLARGRVEFDLEPAPDGGGHGPTLTAEVVAEDGVRHRLLTPGRYKPAYVRNMGFYRSHHVAGILGSPHRDAPALKRALADPEGGRRTAAAG